MLLQVLGQLTRLNLVFVKGEIFENEWIAFDRYVLDDGVSVSWRELQLRSIFTLFIMENTLVRVTSGQNDSGIGQYPEEPLT